MARIFADPDHSADEAREIIRPHDDMRREYEFDYTQARPNGFASRLQGNVVAVVLEPDVAQVFDSSESVNRFLRSVISAVPKRRKQAAARKARRKVS